MRVLIAIPYEPARSQVWPEMAARLAARLSGANPEMVFELVIHPCPRTREPGDGRFSANARARNNLLDTHLAATHDYVFWVDSDLIDYPADLPTRLHNINPGGMSAPAVVLPSHIGRDRFYDTLGFIEYGGGTRLFPPWFGQPGPIVELDSVGSCYLAPADIYRKGARYADVPRYTEHMAVMWAAKAAGRRIVCDTRLVATHAWLPDFGEAAH